MWNQVRKKLIENLKNSDTVENYLDRFYGARDDRPTQEKFIQDCINKFDLGRQQHQDDWNDFKQIIRSELYQEYCDTVNYELMDGFKDEIR